MKQILMIGLFLGMAGLSHADVPDSQKVEVEHLFDFIKNTECEIERNGSRYNGPEALAHMKKKYDYYRDDIDTTEKMIELSATKSMMSRKFYLVHCKGKATQKTQDWLLEELRAFRG